jgi:hypothetical protein
LAKTGGKKKYFFPLKMTDDGRRQFENWKLGLILPDTGFQPRIISVIAIKCVSLNRKRGGTRITKVTDLRVSDVSALRYYDGTFENW